MKKGRKDYIGSIPDDWNYNKIKYIANIYTGNSISDDEKELYEDSVDAVPYIATKDIELENSSIDYSNGMFVKKNDKKFKRARKNDTLLCIEGGSAGKKVAILNQEVAFVNKLCCFNAYSVDKLFLYYFIKSKAFNEEFSQNIMGLIGGVSQTAINQFEICYPTIEEQKLIGSFLKTKEVKINSVLKDLKNQIDILTQYKKALITETVTKGLDSKTNLIDSEIEWIGKIPKHWKIKIIKNIATLKGRIGWEGLTADEYIEEGPTLITGINFDNGNIDWSSCEHVSDWRYNQDKSIQIRDNDLLITKDGTVGKVALVKSAPEKVTLNSGVLLLRPQGEEYIVKFLYYVLLSDEFWHWFDLENIGNTTIIHLYQNRFAKFKLVIPPLEEQREIVKHLDNNCKLIDEIIEKKQNQIIELESYKESIIYEYVTGKKRVKGVKE